MSDDGFFYAGWSACEEWPENGYASLSTVNMDFITQNVGGGMMIHCGNPISYASVNTPYWQSHFYAYGRLP